MRDIADPSRLSLSLLSAYAAPALPLAALYLPLQVHLAPFYAQHQGVDLAALGIVLLLVRLFDAATDPLMGWLSDRGGPWPGRRRGWMLAALPFLVIGTLALLRPPEAAGLGWFAAFMVLTTLGWTMVSVPYLALGAEISGAYTERARITVWRETAGLVGTIAALVLVAQAGLGAVAIAVALLLPPAMVWLSMGAREPVRLAGQSPPGFVAMLQVVARDRVFLRLLLAFLINGAANGLPPVLFLFYTSAILEASEETAGALLLLYFLAAVLGGSLWSRGVRSISKHRLWCVAMIAACAVFLPAVWLGPGDLVAFGVICAASGLLLGADLALPPAIQADVLDRDRVAHGTDAAGSFFALWALAAKAALALSGGVALIALDWTGFRAGGENPPLALSTLALAYAVAPVVLKLMAVAIMWNFPIGRDEQAALRAEIDGR